MEVIRQDHHRIDLEGKPLLRVADRIAKAIDVFDQQATFAVDKIDREKVGAAWDECATIVGHVRL